MVDTKKLEEELPIELLQKGVSISDNEVLNHEKWDLQEIEGTLFTTKEHVITAQGVNNSLRNVKDGIAMFGIRKQAFIPDIEVTIPEDYLTKIKNPNLFLIYYRRDFQRFYLESINENKETYFIFVWLEQPHILTTETIIVSIQNYNFKIKTSANKKEVLIEYGQSESWTKGVFKSDTKTMYLIGRKPENDIVWNDTAISREQAMIYFENGNWYIKDGSATNASSSGTWWYIEKKYQIQDSFTFRVGPSKMKVTVTKPKPQED